MMNREQIEKAHRRVLLQRALVRTECLCSAVFSVLRLAVQRAAEALHVMGEALADLIRVAAIWGRE